MKIIVSDFDKTFFTEKYEENIKLINEFIKEGNVFIIATGRPIYLLKPDIEKYNINYKYLICNDGAVIFDEKEKVIFEDNMNEKDMQNIFYELQSDKNLQKVYIDAIFNFSTDASSVANGIVALPIDRDLAQKRIDSICEKYHSVQGYLSHRWINILTSSASKGKAIKNLAEKNGWNIKEIVTIGDNLNDLSMSKDFNSYAVKGDKTLMQSTKHVVEDFADMMEQIK